MRKSVLAALAVSACAVVAFSLLAAEGGAYSPALWSGMKYRMIGPDARRPRHRGHRRPLAALHLLHGLDRRRRLEDHRRGPHLEQHLRRHSSRSRPWARSKSRCPIRTSSTPAPAPPRSAATSRSAAACTSPPTPARPGRSSACATPARSRPIRVHPANPDIVYVAALGNPFAPQSRSRRVPHQRRRQDLDRRSSIVSDTLGAADLEIAARQPERALRLHVARRSASRGRSSAARMKAASTRAPTAATPGPSSPAACRSELFGRANVAISASKPNRIYALIEAKPGAGLYRSEDAGATWTLINGHGSHHHAAVLLRHAGRRSQQRRRRLRRRRKLVPQHRRRQDLPPRHGAARRPSRHLDQPEELAVT